MINKSRVVQFKRWVRDGDCSQDSSSIDVREKKMCPDGDGVNDWNLKTLRFFLSLSFSDRLKFNSTVQELGPTRQYISEWFMWLAWIARRLITNHRLITRVVEAQAFLSIDCFKVAAADKAELFVSTSSCQLVSCRKFGERELTWKSEFLYQWNLFESRKKKIDKKSLRHRRATTWRARDNLLHWPAR